MVRDQLVGRKGGQSISPQLPSCAGTALLAVASSLHSWSTYWAPPPPWVQHSLGSGNGITSFDPPTHTSLFLVSSCNPDHSL